MPRPLALVFFVSVMVLVTGGLHYYLWARLIRDTVMPAPYRGVATWLLISFAVAMPATLLANRVLPRGVMAVLVWPAYVWMGFMMLLFLVLLVGDAVRLGSHVAGVDGERRAFLLRAIGAGAAAIAGGAGLFAIRNALGALRVTHHEVTLANLPRVLDGTKIVQLTDLHVGPMIGRDWLANVVARTNALSPDVVAITGDLVDGSVAQLRDSVAPLAGLKARYGVFFVTGNHEYYSGVVEWEAELGRLGVRVLRNEHVRVGAAADGTGESFDLAGVDDYNAKGFAHGHGPDMPRAVAGRAAGRALVLMAHQPRHVHEASQHGVGLQLSGHTHGGQIWPWGFMVRLQQGFLAGLQRVGDTWLYTSCGTGYWGPPMRLGADPEIARSVLRSA